MNLARRNPLCPCVLALAALAGCVPGGATPGGPSETRTLNEARRGFVTKPNSGQPRADPAPSPPRGVFRRVRYNAPAGSLTAYLTPDPGDGQKHPAIVWITGGDCNTIDAVWEPAPRDNDQTAAVYRELGVVMMFPSLRGGNDNPGEREGFFGEVDDVMAAAEYLARRPYVDPARVYLGGHSTGGTLAMLVAESTDRFRAVFSFGPVDDVGGYGSEYLPFNTWDRKEVALRSPGRWLHSVRCPLFVFEGTDEPSNLPAIRPMARASKNPLIHIYEVPGTNHFSVLAPTNEKIADKILRDSGPVTNISFTEAELSRP
ncbi:MAG: prolyl oligopeptidase family serine peptidase [Isosphaeraceae bacterium]